MSSFASKPARPFFLGTIVLLSLSFLCPEVIRSQEPPKGRQTLPNRLKREDSYLGVHFDFHAELTDKNIGQNTTSEMVNAIIDIIGPDYIEVDTKGHPGVSSYPTRVGNHGGSFVGDPLRVWREVTAKRGVALYGHHSGVFDALATAQNRQWTAVDPQGKPIGSSVSVFGPYPDKLLIPQLTELAVDYGLDGAWVDGDCWATMIDYSDVAKNAFSQQTGIQTIPTKPADPNWFEWTQFQREAFREYVRHYVAEVKKRTPDFQFASNWAFTQQMPEPVSCSVDFISGDIAGRNCVNICRYNSRLMASQAIAWDLMSWSFVDWKLGTLDPPETRKPAVQLMREAACVIAQGGGYQVVFSQAGPGTPPLRDGSVDLEKLKPMGEVARFCRERQEVSFQADSVPQVAVVCSTDAAYRKFSQQGRLFQGHAPQYGIVGCLLENQYAVDVLVSARLSRRLREYPMVVICDWDCLEPDLRNQIADYVKQGGKALLIGEGPIHLFRKELDAAGQSRVEKTTPPYSLSFFTVGNGMMGIIPQAIDAEYAGNPNGVVRDLVGTAIKTLFPDPLVTVSGSHDIDVSIMRTRNGRLAIHLVNTSGPHHTAGLIPAIDPVNNLSVMVRSKVKPKSVLLQPGNRPCTFHYENGMVHMSMDAVKIHEIIVLECAAIP
ncbi:MAG TPA: hypothetical protein PLU30_00515 [Verrucomicrobiae bacterium]|nr:hypothetical protein [Verrucomicrobiae bacterium]